MKKMFCDFNELNIKILKCRSQNKSHTYFCIYLILEENKAHCIFSFIGSCLSAEHFKSFYFRRESETNFFILHSRNFFDGLLPKCRETTLAASFSTTSVTCLTSHGGSLSLSELVKQSGAKKTENYSHLIYTSVLN